MGIPLIALLFVMESHYPKVAPQGFESFNVAFEFVKTPQQIDALFTDFTSITFSNINRATHLDFSLITLCSLFLLLYAIKTMKVNSNRWLFFVIPLAIIVFVANCVENIFLLKIVEIYSSSLTEATLLPLLKNLQLFNWLKWGALALIFFIFAFHRNGAHTILNLESLAFTMPIILMFWALTGDPMGITRFALSIIIAFSLLFLRSFVNPEAYERLQEATA